jgi:hypothetical protein
VEFHTQQLDNAKLAAQLRLIAELCVEFDPSGLDVSYGWACKLGIDDLYKDHRVESDRLLDFVEESTDRGIFILGQSDLYIHGAGVGFSFRLCHESDIHFESTDLALASRVVSVWKAAGLSVHEIEPAPNG